MSFADVHDGMIRRSEYLYMYMTSSFIRRMNLTIKQVYRLHVGSKSVGMSRAEMADRSLQRKRELEGENEMEVLFLLSLVQSNILLAGT